MSADLMSMLGLVPVKKLNKYYPLLLILGVHKFQVSFGFHTSMEP